MSAITDWCNAFDRAKIILLFGKLMGFLTHFMVEMGQIIGGGGLGVMAVAITITDMFAIVVTNTIANTVT